MADKSLFQQITDGIANAVTDIREKLVEEPWFGRSLSDKADADQGQTWAEFTAPREFGSVTREIEPGRSRTEPEAQSPERDPNFRASNLYLGGYENATKRDTDREPDLGR